MLYVDAADEQPSSRTQRPEPFYQYKYYTNRHVLRLVVSIGTHYANAVRVRLDKRMLLSDAHQCTW